MCFPRVFQMIAVKRISVRHPLSGLVQVVCELNEEDVRTARGECEDTAQWERGVLSEPAIFAKQRVRVRAAIAFFRLEL